MPQIGVLEDWVGLIEDYVQGLVDLHVHFCVFDARYLGDYCAVSKPYEVVREVDSDGDQIIHRIAVKATPIHWGVLIGEVAHNARSALDHVASQLAVANGKDPERCRTAFPIASVQGQFHNGAYDGRIAAIDRRHWALIDSLQPCQNVNDGLLGECLPALDALWNADKHRLFHTTTASTGSGYSTMSVQPLFATPGREAELFSLPFPRLPIDGAVIAKVPGVKNAEVDVEIDQPLDVILDEADPILKNANLRQILWLTVKAAAHVVGEFVGAEPDFGPRPNSAPRLPLGRW